MWFRWNVKHWTSGVNVHNKNSNRYVPFYRSILNLKKKSMKGKYQLNYFICIKNFNTETIKIVYIDTGSPVRYIPSKSCDLADENNNILTEWKWFETTVLIVSNISCLCRADNKVSFTINVSWCSEFCGVISVTISTQKRCSVRLYLQLFVGGLMSYLRYLYLTDENNNILTEWKWFETTLLIVSNISCLCRADNKVNTI
jgi:hypothetical protein